MRLQEKSSLCEAVWSSYSEDPVWQSSWWAGRLCAPFILLPEDSPDGKWHLFAHTWAGIEHFISTSGFDWQRISLVALRGHFPSVFKEKDTYYLVYENHDYDYQNKRRLDLRKTISRINIMSSTDLRLWSRPQTILSAADVPYASDYSAPRLSHPQIINWQGSYRLYFCASEVRLYDTKQKASACLSYAQSTSFNAPFEIRKQPVLRIDPDSRYRNLALGSFRFVSCSDALAAFQTTIFFDEKKERTNSAILLLTSDDGEVFHLEKVLMTSPSSGWASRCFTSCSVSYKADENTWYCYYSANGKDEKHRLMPLRESLGLLIGNVKREF